MGQATVDVTDTAATRGDGVPGPSGEAPERAIEGDIDKALAEKEQELLEV